MEFAQKNYKIIAAALNSGRKDIIHALILLGLSVNDYFIRSHYVNDNNGKNIIKPLRKINRFCKKRKMYCNLLTPLTYAIKTNNLPTIEILIRAGALLNTQQHCETKINETILNYSTIPMIEYFIKEWKCDFTKKINETYLIESNICKNEKCDNIGNFCELLIANGVKINISLLAIVAIYWRRKPLFEWCMANGADDSYIDNRYGNVYLQLAISNGIDSFDVSDLLEIYKQKYGEVKNMQINNVDPINFCISSEYLNDVSYIKNLINKFECPVNKHHPTTNELPCVWLVKNPSRINHKYSRLLITCDTFNALSREGHSIYYIALHSENWNKYKGVLNWLNNVEFWNKVKAIKYNHENETNYYITNYEFTKEMINNCDNLKFYSPNYLIKYITTNQIDNWYIKKSISQYNKNSVNENGESIIEIIINTHEDSKDIISEIVKTHILTDKDLDVILKWDYEIYYKYIKNKLNYEYKHTNGDSIVTALIKNTSDSTKTECYYMIKEIIESDVIIHDIDNGVLENYKNELFMMYKSHHALIDPRWLKDSLLSIECPFCRQNTNIDSYHEENYKCLICYEEQTVSITLACNGKHGHMCMKCTHHNKTTQFKK